MELSEFLNDSQLEPEEQQPEEIDIQKAVVESLAADKAEQDELISSLHGENSVLKNENKALKFKIAELRNELIRIGDLLIKNSERIQSNQISLLDRDANLDDRFEGETRDHVLEALKDARDEAEKKGRLRHAQILESVLVANEPHGELARRRADVEKLFIENANVITGVVIAELEKRGIAHKNGEDYLLPSEIIARNY